MYLALQCIVAPGLCVILQLVLDMEVQATQQAITEDCEDPFLSKSLQLQCGLDRQETTERCSKALCQPDMEVRDDIRHQTPQPLEVNVQVVVIGLVAHGQVPGHSIQGVTSHWWTLKKQKFGQRFEASWGPPASPHPSIGTAILQGEKMKM